VVRKLWPGILLAIGAVVTGCAGDTPMAAALAPISSAAASVETASAPPPPAPVPVPVPAPAERATPARPRLMLTLRSSPPGAAASVDGRLVGTTPVRWEMEDDSRTHEFSFLLTGHAPWRLRFSPARDGVIHATLEPLPEGPDAGARLN
jgi:hypothetical protein